MREPCRHCGEAPVLVKARSEQGGTVARQDDACIPDLPGVRFACCGHYNAFGNGPYLVLSDGSYLHGVDALTKMIELGGSPPVGDVPELAVDDCPREGSATTDALPASASPAGRGQP